MNAASSAVPANNAPTLIRALGLWDSVALIMGIMIGSGIFLMAGSIALHLDSLAAVAAAWALGGALSVCGALALSELGAAFPSAGGLYVYLTEIYGPGTGFVYGWSAMALIHAGSIATLAAAVGLYAAPMLGLSAVAQKVLQMLCIVAFTIVNCIGVGLGKWVQNILTAAKILGLVLMVVLLFSRGQLAFVRSAWLPHNATFQWTSFGVALVAVLWAYDGWHFVSFAAGEVKDPIKTLPRSLMIGATLTFFIYLAVNTAYYFALPQSSIRGSNRVAADAVEHLFGTHAGVFISILITISILGAMNGIVLGAPRVNWAMARNGLFFRSFARVHPRFHTPVIATIAQGLWATAFTLVGSFQQLFISYVFTSWIFYGLCVAGVLILRKRRPELTRPYLCPGYPWTPLIFLIATSFIVGSTILANFKQAVIGVGLISIGIPLYFVFRQVEKRHQQATESAQLL